MSPGAHRRLWGRFAWALRDVRRRPVRALVSSAGLFILVTLVGAVVLTAEGLARSSAESLRGAPSLVVQRLDGAPWTFDAGGAADKIGTLLGVSRVGETRVGPAVKTAPLFEPSTSDAPRHADLGVWVRHPEEVVSLVPEIREAAGTAIRMTTRDELRRRDAAFLARRSGLALWLLVPAVLGLALLTASSMRERLSDGSEVGLMKALGWTTGDVAACHLWRAVVVAVPGVVLGLLAAFLSAAAPDVTWPLALLWEWEGHPVPAGITAESALVSLSVICGGVLVPWLTAAVVPIWLGSAADPADWLQGA